MFTDIEGSTRLWQEHREGMRSALARHDELLGEAITGNGGHVVKSTGDGAYAVFDRAHNAAAAAVAVQMFFQHEQFEDVGRLKVRMTLHTGEADERQGDYFGPALNRAARLLDTGHGGQVLVTAATREVLGDHDYEFVDLGDHRLRDLARPERVHQLLHPDLPRDFPPLLSLDARPNNLPSQLTSFIGRDDELRQVSKLLEQARLVSLTGVGGAGKTRLALQVAAELLDSYDYGAWLVELATVSDPALVINQAAEPFGVRDMETDSGRLLIDVLSDYLADKELVLVLDNCEHVIEASASLSETLLTLCPRLSILTTSRELLGVPGEAAYPVPPLGLPTEESIEIDEADAVYLFAERAAQVQPDFRLNPDTAPVVQEITRRLDGLPLAIELAASRTTLLTPQQILERLDEQFGLITSRRRGRGRHATLEAAMDWSYELLSEQERSLFRQLAVFSGGWTLESAEAVCEPGEGAVLDLLGHLVDQSLIEVAAADGESRYRLLEPVRQYALTRLSEGEEEDAVRRRHAEHLIELATAAEAGLRGTDQRKWAGRIELEHDNVRGALEWSIDAGHDELALRLLGAMGWFWWVRGYWKEAQRWFRRVYEAMTNADPLLRARAVYKVASLEVQRARPAEVRPLLEEALEVVRERGNEHDVAWVMVHLADAMRVGGLALSEESMLAFESVSDPWGAAYAKFILGLHLQESGRAEGLTYMREAVEALAEVGDRWAAGWLAFILGQALANEGTYEEAREVIERSLELVEGSDDRWVAPHCKSRLGMVAALTGNTGEAERLFDEALPVHQRIGDENCTAFVHVYLGQVLTDGGDHGRARQHLINGLEGYRELQNPYGVANGLRRSAWWAADRGDHERAVRLLAAADALRGELGGFISVHDRERMSRVTESLRAVVEPEQWSVWWDEGENLSQDEAIEYALQS